MSNPMTEPLNPYDRCAVCDTTREEHGDKHHAFSLDGELIPLKPGMPPRRQAPTPRGAMPMNLESQTTGLLLRLIERLAQKGLLEGPDMVMIFGGPNVAPARGSATDQDLGDSGSQEPRRGSGSDPSER